jgi:DNA-binding XRE family transcriptional regulator
MNRIKYYREQLKLTQKELGLQLSPPLGQGAVCNHEVGLRTPDVRQALSYARALGVSVEELFPVGDQETAGLPSVA